MIFGHLPLTAYVGLGSNMGNAHRQLRLALSQLGAIEGIRINGASPVFRTEPQGFVEQPFFFNQVARLECLPGWSAHRLLDILLETELSLGRVRKSRQRFGPRSIDLDLLLFGNKRIKTEHLTLPHPRMQERAFVMVPLARLAPDLLLPCGLTVCQALKRLDYKQKDDLIFQKPRALHP